MGRGGRSVHGDMHSRETEHCLNMNGDEEPLPEPEERRTTKYVSAGNLFDGTIEDGHRVFRANLRRYRRLGIYTVLCVRCLHNIRWRASPACAGYSAS